MNVGHLNMVPEQRSEFQHVRLREIAAYIL